MAYHFVNRRPKAYNLVFWETSKGYVSTKDFSKSNPIPVLGGWGSGYGEPRAKKAIGPGATLDFDSSTPVLAMYVQGGNIVGPFHVQNDTHYVLHDTLDNPMTSVEQSWATMSKRLGMGPTPWRQAPPPSGEEMRAAEIAGSVIAAIAGTLFSALSTGLSAGGSSFAVGAGASAGIGGILSMVMDGFEPVDKPLPPTLDTLTEAIADRIETLIQVESDRDHAKMATNVIDNTVVYFKNRLFHYKVGQEAPGSASSRGEGNGRGRKHYAIDGLAADNFRTELESAMRVVEGDTFASYVKFAAKNPEVARFMMPSFLAGVGMWATLRRIEIGMEYGAQRGRATVPPWVIEEYWQQLKELRDGLLNSIKSYMSYRTSLLAEVKMSALPHEATPLIKRMGEELLGDALALPDPMYKTYSTDSDYASPEGSGWNYENAIGSSWLGESGWVYVGDGGAVRTPPPLDCYCEALAQLNRTIELVQTELNKSAAGNWPDGLLPVQPQTS